MKRVLPVARRRAGDEPPVLGLDLALPSLGARRSVAPGRVAVNMGFNVGAPPIVGPGWE